VPASRIPTPPAQTPEQCLGIFLWTRRLFVAIDHAETTTDIDMLERDAIARQFVDHGKHPVQRIDEGFERGQLRADMTADAADVDVRQRCGASVKRSRIIDRHAELVFAQSG